MLDRLIRWSLAHRVVVLCTAAASLVAGGVWVGDAPLDVFPDLSAPTVTVITEAPGMAPEEIELLVTFPLEAALNGGPGVRRIRSVSAAGIAVIWVEFEWGEDVYRTRQIVAERIQGVRLPDEVEPPVLGPISSIMGEITFIALTSDTVSQLELRRVAEVNVRRALLAIPGISQVIPIGGEQLEFQVEVDPAALRQRGLGLGEVLAALEAASQSPAAGFHVDRGQEYLVRGLSRADTAEDLAAAVIEVLDGFPVTVGDVAEVRAGALPRRGTASYRTEPAVVLSVQKQPDANTLEVTREIDRVLESVATSLPEGIVIQTENFRQSDFIEVAVRNVARALRDGGILVALILLLFLGNVRTTLISLFAIPLSLVASLSVLSLLGGTINTMTLGGLTIAVGALVDDAIIDVENVLRRLREARRTGGSSPGPLEIVYRATVEVRKAILFATLIIVVVFVPLFLLPGIEGRLLRPLGLAYIVALAASFLVSLTVTPVLCSFLLPGSRALEGESKLLASIERRYRWLLERVVGQRVPVLAGSAALFAAALAVVPSLDRSFLPPFNEGSLTIGVTSAPGITLDDSDRLGRQVEESLLAFPEVVSTSRRTGRAEKDEHVQGINRSELEVVLRPGRPKDELLEEIRHALATIPGISVDIGQPISHRIDHMISGSRTNLAVKIFGPDLTVLRSLGTRIEGVLAGVDDIVDLSNEEQASVPQLLIDVDRRALARYGVSAAELAAAVEALFQGAAVGEVYADGLVSRVVVRLPEALRDDRDRLAALPVLVEGGSLLRLDQVADVRFDLGPSLVRRENAERVAVLTANVAGTDLAGTVEEARDAVREAVDLPEGYRVVFGGQFEEADRSLRRLALLSLLILAGMYGLLYLAFRSHRDAAIVSVNLPLSLIGGILAIWSLGEPLSVATLVGFVTLFGIATRNGVLLVTRYQALIGEGASVAEAVHRGSLERLAPILMTALTAGLALVPLVVAGQEPGNEIQSPMGLVIIGGLVSSTLLNLIVVPVLFASWGERRAG